MLIEKAFAKLHGCYEAIAYGLIEKAFLETTGGSTVTFRAEALLPEDICDTVFAALEVRHMLLLLARRTVLSWN